MTPKYGRAPNKTQGAVVIFPTTSWIQNGAGSSTLQDTFAEETAFWKTDRTYPVITVLNLHGTRNVKQKTTCLLKPALNQPTAPEFRGPQNTNFRLCLSLASYVSRETYVPLNDGRKPLLDDCVIYDWILNSWLDLKNPQRFGINLASSLIPPKNNLNEPWVSPTRKTPETTLGFSPRLHLQVSVS